MITYDQVHHIEAIFAIIVWSGATWRWRGHWYDGPWVGSLMWLLVLIGLSSRSFLSGDVALFTIAVVRGLYIIIGAAVWWTGPPKEHRA